MTEPVDIRDILPALQNKVKNVINSIDEKSITDFCNFLNTGLINIVRKAKEKVNQEQ